CFEHAFRRRGDSHANPHVAAVTMRLIGLAEVGVWPDRLVLDLSSANGPPPAGFKSLRDRTFLLTAGDECDRIEQPCFVQAQWGSAPENQACQCQRQNGLNFQVSLPGGQHACPCRRQSTRHYRSKALHLTLSAEAPGEGAPSLRQRRRTARTESEFVMV